MKSAITISLVEEARGGPFVFHDGLADGCARAAKLGFDAVEIFPPSAEAIDVRQLQSLLDQHQLQVAAVGTGAGWVRHKLRLTDPDPAIRQQAREFISAIVDFAGRLGAPAILGSMQGRWEGNVPRTLALGWLAEAVNQFGHQAAQYGVPFLYEFLNRYETNLCNRVDESLEFLRSLSTTNVRLLCDLFHMNIEESDVAGAIVQAGGSVGHVHYADSNRCAMGQGHTDPRPLVAALRRIGYAGYLSAEVFPRPDSQAAAEQTINSFRQVTSC